MKALENFLLAALVLLVLALAGTDLGFNYPARVSAGLIRYVALLEVVE